MKTIADCLCRIGEIGLCALWSLGCEHSSPATMPGRVIVANNKWNPEQCVTASEGNFGTPHFDECGGRGDR